MLWLNGILLRSPSRVVSPRLPTIQEGRRIRRNGHAELRADKRTSRFLLRSTGSHLGKCINTSTHRPRQSPVGPQWFPQFLFLVSQMLLKQWNGPRGHSWTDQWRAQRWPPSGLHHLWETDAPQSVSQARGRRNGKTTTKGTHQVKRHKDGMQELWRVRLRDVRLQTGLKKQANGTHVGGLYRNGPANLRFNSPEGKESTWFSEKCPRIPPVVEDVLSWPISYLHIKEKSHTTATLDML